MDAETRAALKWMLADCHGIDPLIRARLQALLDDEKGGEPGTMGSKTGHLATETVAPLCQSATEVPAAGVLRPAPPDSPAKIAADLRTFQYTDEEGCDELDAIAARIEALDVTCMNCGENSAHYCYACWEARP